MIVRHERFRLLGRDQEGHRCYGPPSSLHPPFVHLVADNGDPALSRA